MKGFTTTHRWTLVIFSSILILDQITKYLVRSLMSPYMSKNIIHGFFNLVYVMNRGGAFGILSERSELFRGIVFISFSVITIFVLILIYIRSNQDFLMRFGITFLLGGAIGNLIDRIRFGAVVDFLDFYLGKYHWPAFNVADMAICTGLGLILLGLFLYPALCPQSQ